MATTLYHSRRNPMRKITTDSEKVDVGKGDNRCHLHKVFLRYHNANNWPLLPEALKAMGRADLIGNGKLHLIPSWQPLAESGYQSVRRKNSTPQAELPAASALKPTFKKASQPRQGQTLTQHTGLPPRKKS
jgi:hypothetical protein